MFNKKIKKKDLIVHKPNQLIEITGGALTATSLVIYNYILYKLQQNGQNHMIISGNDFFKDLSLSKHYDDLANNLNLLRDIDVISKDKKGELWGSFSLLSAFKRMDDGTFYVEVSNLIFEALYNPENKEKKDLYYTTIELLEQRVFKSCYSIIFYEIFKKYEKVNIPIYTVDQLKHLTRTIDKYKQYKYFKRDVLDKALDEINKINNKYEILYLEERLGRKVHKIKFIRSPYLSEEEEKNIIISADIAKAMAKALKNKYVSAAFSQKAVIRLIKQFDESDIIKGFNEAYNYTSAINNFGAFMTAKISDIQRTKSLVKGLKIEEVQNTINEVIEDVPIIIEPIKVITKQEYEEIYLKYLKDNSINDIKSTRISFKKMTANKYKIKE